MQQGARSQLVDVLASCNPRHHVYSYAKIIGPQTEYYAQNTMEYYDHYDIIMHIDLIN